jgi:hypothetical protein
MSAASEKVLSKLAAGEIPVATAVRMLAAIEQREAQESSTEAKRAARRADELRQRSAELAAAPRFAASAIRPRAVTPIIADRQVLSAYRAQEVTKAQTSAMNCYVLDLV